MLNKLIEYLNETKDNIKTEYKTIKKQKGSKLFYWLIIASIVAAFFLYANDVRSNTQTQTESIHQEFKELRDEIRFELRKQNIDIDKRLEDQNNRLEGIKAAKAEKARLARQSIANQRVSVQRVSGNCGAELTKYDWPHDIAHKVLLQESGDNPGRINNNPVTKDYSVGCFQINLFGRNRLTRPSEDWLKVASNNVSYAYQIYVGQGRTFCTTGGWYNTCKKLNLI